MPPPSILYDTLLNLLQHAPWRDRRHLLTLAWMVRGLLSSGWIALSEWTPVVVGRALLAQSTERRFRGWLSNPRIDVLHLYAALLRPVRGECPDRRLLVVLDTARCCGTCSAWCNCAWSTGAGRFPWRGRSCGTVERERRVPGLPRGVGVRGAAVPRLRGGAVGRPGFPARRVVALGRAHGGLASSRALQTERGVVPPDGPGLWPAGVAAVAGGSALLPRGVRGRGLGYRFISRWAGKKAPRNPGSSSATSRPTPKPSTSTGGASQ